MSHGSFFNQQWSILTKLFTNSANKHCDETPHGQDTSNDKGENPLECKHFSCQLSKGQGKHEVSVTEPNGPVVEQQQKETWNKQKVPNKDISQDAAKQLVDVEHNSTVPEKCIHDPGDRHGGQWNMDQEPVDHWFDSECLVGKVQRKQVEQVDDQDDLTQYIMTRGEQFRPDVDQDVEDGEVPADQADDGQAILVGEEYLGGVDDLPEVQDPPVDEQQGVACGERSVSEVALWHPGVLQAAVDG